MGAGRSHLKAERLVRVEEGSGLHIELLAEGSLARLAREAVDMLGEGQLQFRCVHPSA